jgi:hypothetical protein
MKYCPDCHSKLQGLRGYCQTCRSSPAAPVELFSDHDAPPPTEAPEQETPAVSLPAVVAPVVPMLPEPVEAVEGKVGRPTRRDAGVREVKVPALGDRVVEVEWQTAVYLVHEAGRFRGSIRHERNGGLFEWSVHAPNDIERPCADKEAGVNFLTGLAPEPLLTERQRETLILEATRALAAIVAAKEAWERSVEDGGVDKIEAVFDAIDQASATVDFLPADLRAPVIPVSGERAETREC